MDEKQKLIDDTVKELQKQFEDIHIGTLETEFDDKEIGFVPTGNLAIDYVIGRRGFPLGRISEIAGRSGSAKSSALACAIGAAQKAGMVCILNDTEHSYDPSWAKLYGVNPNELIFPEPGTLEEMFDVTIASINHIREVQSDIPVFIAVDSVSASPTSSELEQEDSSASKQRAEHAKIISLNLRKLTNLIWNQNVALLFVSQLKDNPGGGYGQTTSKLGGAAIQFHSALQLEFTRTAYITEDSRQIGRKIQIKSIKNKFAPPYRVFTFDLFYEDGIHPKEILLDFLASDDIKMVTAKGAWYEYEGSKYRRKDLAEKLDDSLFEVVYEKLGIPK